MPNEQVEVADRPIVFELEPQSDSGVSGTAELLAVGEDETKVTVVLSGADEEVAHPAHIHRGDCENLDPTPFAPLESASGRTSATTVETSLIELIDGEFAVNVHASEEDLETYIACGEVPDKDEVAVDPE